MTKLSYFRWLNWYGLSYWERV